LQAIGQNAWQVAWSPAAAYQGTVYLFVVVQYGNAGITSSASSVPWSGSVTAAGSGGPPAPRNVGNAAGVDLDGITQLNQVAAGSYIELGAQTGTSLADGTDPYPGFPFPTKDQGTQVFLGSVALEMSYVSAGQINALVPATMALGAQQLTVVKDGIPSVNSPQVIVASIQPGILPTYWNNQGAILNNRTGGIAAPTTSPYSGATPAIAGKDYIEIYCNGLGPVSNPPGYGQGAAGGSNLSQTPTLPTVTIGGMPATVTFSGLSPGSVALYQVDALVPAGISASDAVDVVLQMQDPVTNETVTSNTVTIAVQ
jgi:uncharacterized protein (TIGR03437 family)